MWNGARSCAFAVSLALALTCTARPSFSQPARSAAVDRLVMPPDFPPADELVWMLEQRGLTARLAAEALAAAPDATETLDLLMRAGRIDEAVGVLSRIIDRHPTRIEAAFDLTASQLRNVPLDPLHVRPDGILEVAARATTALRQLPREAAARAARSVLALQRDLVRSPNADRMQPLRDFVAEWRGTEAAQLTEVDLIASDPTAASRQYALDAFARARRGTTAAAKAQYIRGADLAHNTPVLTVDGTADDPFKRFLLVRDIVSDLASRRYPSCEWVNRASDLIVGFFAHEPKYDGDALRTIIGAYEQFARARLALEPNPSARSPLGYLVTNKLAVLYAARGDRPGAVERFLATLTEDTSTAEPAQYLLALYDMDRSNASRSAAERSDWAARTRTALTALTGARAPLYQRRALANLAILEYRQHEDEAAIGYLTEYMHKYPDAAWTWVAALRLGKAYEARNEWPSASKVYADAASRYASNPVAAVLAHAYAGQAFDALERFDDAAKHYQDALNGWDDGNGFRYSLHLGRPSRAHDPLAVFKDDSEVTRTSLTIRVAQLNRTLRAPGGALLERARWQFGYDRLDDAIATTAALVTQYPQSPNVPDARALSHRARVDRALESGDHSGLEALERERYDFWILASKLTRAATMLRAGAGSNAEALMTDAFGEWHRHQAAEAPAARPADLAKDVVEIRNLVFRPKGDGVFAGSSWELRTLSPETTPYFVVNPDVDVKLSSGTITRVTVRQPFPDYPNVLFLDGEQLAFFDRLLARVGGTERRQPRAIMEVPNQPVGGSMEILNLLRKFFPARPGHWGGWMFATPPTISTIEFLDAARTKAGVHVTVGYEGAALVLEKKDGLWTFKEMVGRWIT